MEIIGNRNQYLKSLKLEQYWDMKKSGAISIMEKVDVHASSGKGIGSDQEKEQERAIQKKLNKIKAKLRAGARLTGAEKAFLRKHAPKLYLEMLKLEREQAAYEERLKRCRTRDEVEQVKNERFQEVAAASKEQSTEETIAQYNRMQAAEKNVASEIRRKPWQSDLDRKKRKIDRQKEEREKRVREKKEQQKRIKEEYYKKKKDQEYYEEMVEEKEENLEIWLETEQMLERQMVEVVEEFTQEAAAPTTKAFAAYRAMASVGTDMEKEKYSRKA